MKEPRQPETGARPLGHAGIEVEVAREEDLDAATKLFRGYLDFYRVAPRDPGRPRAFLAERIAKGDSLILLASTPAGRRVGFAQVYPGLSSLDLGPSWLLSDLYVSPAGRREGVGRALLREVLRRAREAGVSAVQLETAYDNDRAQKLYESEGFVRDPFHVYLHSLN